MSTPNIQPRNIELGNTDHMPKQVALEMLCAPKAKLTNRVRKNCKASRDIVRLSAFPIVKTSAKTGQRPAEYTHDCKEKSIDEKLTGKLKRATFDQLQKWGKRAHARRMQVQRAYLRITGTNVFAEKARAALELKAAHLDIFGGAVYDELQRRSGPTTPEPKHRIER